MNIFEKQTFYAAKYMGDEVETDEWIEKRENHAKELRGILNNDVISPNIKKVCQIEEIFPSELKEICYKNTRYDEAFYDVLQDPHDKENLFEQITVIARKEIEDNLSLEEIEDAKLKFTVQVATSNHPLYEIPDFIFLGNTEFITAEEIYQNEEWAINELFTTEEEINLLSDFKTQNIKDKEFEIAYSLEKVINEQGEKIPTEDLTLNFMKEVIKAHGSQTKILNEAISAVT